MANTTSLTVQKYKISAEKTLADAATSVFYGASSVLGHRGDGMHHTVYVTTANGDVELQVSLDSSAWITSGTIASGARGQLTTGNITEPAPPYTRVKETKAGTQAANTYTVLSFSSLIPPP